MSYRYGLIIKGCKNDTAPDVSRRLAGLAGVQIMETFEVPNMNETDYLVLASQDLTSTLNTWLMEDFGVNRDDVPFPVGSLLYWRNKD